MRRLHAHNHLAAFSTLLAQDHEAKKLNTRDLQVIALLNAQPTPLTVGAISTMLSVHSSHISRISDRLVERGYLQRSLDKSDRRLVLISPTRKGRALDERVRSHFETAASSATRALASA